MNSPRRHRINSSKCRCVECQELATGTEFDPEARMQEVVNYVRADGWLVSAVQGDQTAPPWAYTVGLWQTFRSPELTMAGLPVEHMVIILNTIANFIADGAAIGVGSQIDGICPCTLATRPVHGSWRTTSMFAISDRYYDQSRPAYLQVLWPDKKGNYPSEPGFHLRYEGRQPMLWLPREDHAPGAWTRIDRQR